MTRPRPMPGPPPGPPAGAPPPARRPNRALIVIGVVAVLLASLVAVVLVRTSGDDTAGPEPVDSVAGAVPIPAGDGVTLGAQVTTPSGSGRHPLVVMPSSYGSTSAQYASIARQFAAAGFVVVAYTQRGFHNSGGRIDLAGEQTQRDATTVIDWAIAHAAADPDHIGMLGVSYGGGISLLTAAHDKRVRAVVALSAWANMRDVFHPNDTVSLSGLGGLLSNSPARQSTATTSLLQQLKADPLGNAGEIDAFSKVRSPDSYVSELNANKPAIMLASGWEDSLLFPSPLVPFYDELTTPKRLQLAKGDHGGPEGAALAGGRSSTVDDGLAWLRHYLQGTDNGIQDQAPVRLQDVTTQQVHTYRSWPQAGRLSVSLSAPNPAGTSVTSTPTAWTSQIAVGRDTAANAGPSQFVPAAGYTLPTAVPATISAADAFVWNGTPLASDTLVVGSPTLTVSVSSSSPVAAFFTYVYDVGPDGTGRLMTTKPYTATNLTPAVATPVSVELEPICWTLPAGHHLSVVVDTEDSRWLQPARSGSTLAFSSSTAAPAAISVPIGS